MLEAIRLYIINYLMLFLKINDTCVRSIKSFPGYCQITYETYIAERLSD